MYDVLEEDTRVMPKKKTISKIPTCSYNIEHYARTDFRKTYSNASLAFTLNCVLYKRIVLKLKKLKSRTKAGDQKLAFLSTNTAGFVDNLATFLSVAVTKLCDMHSTLLVKECTAYIS